MRSRIRQGAALLLGAALALLAAKVSLAQYVNFLAYDHLLAASPAGTTASQVVVIGIDDQALERFPEPLVLWHPYLSRVIEGAADAGAAAIGLDIIPSISLESLAPEADRELARTLRSAAAGGTPVILGYDAGQHGLRPHRRFAFMASGLGFLNFWPDTDGIIRQARLFVTESGQRHPSLVLATLDSSRHEAGDPPEWIYVDYLAPSPPVLPFTEVYDRQKQGDAAWLRRELARKIVLIGVTTAKLQDNHRVPLSASGAPGRIPGVEIHGMAIETLLSGSLLRDAPQPLAFGLLLLTSLVTGILFLVLPPARALVLTGALALALGLGVYLAFARGLLLPAAPLLSGLLIPAITCGVYRYVLEYRQFRQLQRYFQSYVNPEVMREIIQNPGTVGLGGKQVTATVMFTDIRNFTTLSERLQPAQVVSGLNRYFEAMTSAVIDAGGYLNRYLGDGILAVFGAPKPLPEAGAMEAVRCALDMLNRLQALNRTTLFPGLEEVRIGIGIHTGESIVGNIGCWEKMDYSIIGDTVNLASRIEGKTKDYGAAVLISETTYQLVRDRIDARLVATTQVKGRAQEVALFEVLKITEGIDE